MGEKNLPRRCRDVVAVLVAMAAVVPAAWAQSAPKSPASDPIGSADEKGRSQEDDAGESPADDSALDNDGAAGDSAAEGGAEGDAGPDESDPAAGDDVRSSIFDPETLPPYEIPGFSSLPGEFISEARVKPGHWTMVHAEARVNQFDFRGELDASLLGADGDPLTVELTPFRLRSTRPVTLAKGTSRFLEFVTYVPIHDRATRVAIRLLQARDDDIVLESRQALLLMPAHQHYLVVLAADPAEYQFLRSLDSIRAPGSWGALSEDLNVGAHYRVAIPSIKNTAPLPSTSLCWTTTAYLVWDGVDPQLLNPDQQEALVDWLHWGGQLIVAGPNSLALAAGSFLEPYLPATSNAAWQFGPETNAAFSQIATKDSRKLDTSSPWAGVKLQPVAGAKVLLAAGGEPLVVEQSHGRGRVAITAFSPGELNLVSWPLYDGIWNQFLLKRPSREFELGGTDVAVRWAGARLPPYTAELTSRLRFFSRDAKAPRSQLAALGLDDEMLDQMQERGLAPFEGEDDELFDPAAANNGKMMSAQVRYSLRSRPGYSPYEEDPYFGQAPKFGTGVAGWDDFNAVAHLARKSLQTAAGIKVPKVGFVVVVIVVYAVVLAPINYLFFRLLRRVEWAWLTAPFIAVACTVAVTYLAQLDIGFARSHTEIAIVEMQPGYSRAHVARFIALYGSLGAEYDVQLVDHGGLALPFARGNTADAAASRSTVEFRRMRKALDDSEDEAEAESRASLERVEFPSNSTGMVHAEHFLDLEGKIQFETLEDGRWKVTNNTQFALRTVRVARRDKASDALQFFVTEAAGFSDDAALPAGGLQGAVLADLQPGESAEATPQTVSQTWIADNGTFAPEKVDGQSKADISAIARLAMLHIAPGETRLIAETVDEVSGIAVRPAASQIRRTTLLVAHLHYDSDFAPQPDVNCRADVDSYAPLPEDDEAAEETPPSGFWDWVKRTLLPSSSPDAP